MWGWFSRKSKDTKDEESSKSNIVCVDCDAKTKQVPLPSNDGISSQGKECGAIYDLVAECMQQNRGQVTACTKEWDAFKNCHSKASTA